MLEKYCIAQSTSLDSQHQGNHAPDAAQNAAVMSYLPSLNGRKRLTLSEATLSSAA